MPKKAKAPSPRATNGVYTEDDVRRDRLLTGRQVASILSIGLRTVYKLRAIGKLTPVEIGAAVRFRESEVRAIVANGAATKAVPA